MNKDYEMQYKKIVKTSCPTHYSTPEDQGRKIQKCSLLKSVQIEYSSTHKTGRLQF